MVLGMCGDDSIAGRPQMLWHMKGRQGAPAEDARNVFGGLALADLDGVRAQVDRVPAQPEEALRPSQQGMRASVHCMFNGLLHMPCSAPQKRAAVGLCTCVGPWRVLLRRTGTLEYS
jgi:hypothetical protein